MWAFVKGSVCVWGGGGGGGGDVNPGNLGIWVPYMAENALEILEKKI